jgi:hypothetical protein
MRLVLIALLVACDAGTPKPKPKPRQIEPTFALSRRGPLYVITTHPAMLLNARANCDRPFDIERRDGTEWVGAGVWYHVPKNCIRYVDEGPPTPKDYCRCEPPRGEPQIARDPPLGDVEVDMTTSSELTWSGTTITGPAPAGHYRLWMPGMTFEFDVH